MTTVYVVTIDGILIAVFSTRDLAVAYIASECSNDETRHPDDYSIIDQVIDGAFR